MEDQSEHRVKSTQEIRTYVRSLRSPIHYLQSCGEEIPIRSSSLDFVICFNVLDHASDPDAVLREIYRILKPSGRFYFGVDTFSLLGLLKWYSWTKHAHRDEILVDTHPYRMYETDVLQRLRSASFQILKLGGHTLRSSVVGHARDSVFLATK